MNLEQRVAYLEKEVTAIKVELDGQPMKRYVCDCGKSIHHEDSIFCSNCGSKLN